MSNQLRKFRRKEQKKWSYEQYKKGKLAEQKNGHIRQARDDFTNTYNRIVPSIIPDWQTKIALMFPPLWWNNTVCFLLRIISPPENREILLQYDMRWKRCFFRMFRFWLANTLYSITIRSLLKIRTLIHEFGIKVKIDTQHKDNKEYMRFRILRFSKCYHEEEVLL